jgi:hypothetical protein
MKFSLSLGTAVFAVGVAAGSAIAQPDPATGDPAPPADPPPPPETTTAAPPPPPPPTTGAPDVGAPVEKTAGPILPNMLPSRLGATIDVRADYTHFSNDAFINDVTMIGLNLHGQYIFPQGYGGYLQIPYYYINGNDDSDNGAGNIELGGLYRLPQGDGLPDLEDNADEFDIWAVGAGVRAAIN